MFRGKRIDNGDWVEGIGIFRDIRFEHYQLQVRDGKEFHWNSIHPDTLGQHTGLTDKNGKKIFEGDIIFDPELKENHIVMFDEGGFCTEEMFLQSYLCFDEMEVEVIGNIHDNPELLEVTE